MDELKVCPICGSKVNMIIAVDFFKSGLPSIGWYVECPNGCCKQQRPFMSDHDAIEAWNRDVEALRRYGKIE